ncbi:MAG: N-acetyl-alpha-D-glucosaminyl L-malate synthase BshA [Candidatus Glassbacteria bacterium]|nr:N-acetyl-alpha-D-glucosaminyl L-malate synthase BshA [Candidatus Glassbacteria bacterium]
MGTEKSNLKIGITCYPTYGGSGVLATELGKRLALHGHEIHFITYALPYRLKEFHRNIYFHEVQVSNYPVFEYQPYTLSLAVKMHDVIGEYGLDLLHLHYAIPHATSAWIARQMLGDKHPVRLITTLHGTDITLVGQEQSFKSITRFSIEQSDGVTAVSNYLRNQTLEIFGVEKPIEVIPNFVDTEVFKRRDDFVCCRKTLTDGTEKIIMHISNMRPVKRLRDVVQVFARVASETRAQLVLVGDGPERAPAYSLAEELGVADRCIFLGAQESIDCLLNCADLLLQPSATESFGLSVLEALSTGVPVVATRCGGPEEVVLQGECGYLSEVGDVEEMARNCLRLLTDRELYEAFSRKAREHAVANFDIREITGRYESFYQSILERSS